MFGVQQLLSKMFLSCQAAPFLLWLEEAGLGLFLCVSGGISRLLASSSLALEYMRRKENPGNTSVAFLGSQVPQLVWLLSVFQSLIFVLYIMSRVFICTLQEK